MQPCNADSLRPLHVTHRRIVSGLTDPDHSLIVFVAIEYLEVWQEELPYDNAW